MKKNRFTIVVIGLIVASIVLIAVLQATKSSERNMYPVEHQEVVYFGDEEAENEILLLFDYSCHWCVVWMEEIYPIIELDYIDTGDVKFRTQAMTYVNEASARLANFDQNIKDHSPENYEDIFMHIIDDTHPDREVNNWGTDDYVLDLISTYQLNEEIMTSPNDLDATELSHTYTQALSIESVPTVYVNGEKVVEDFVTIDGEIIYIETDTYLEAIAELLN